MNKEEIEKAKDDLAFFNEGDYITREMANSANILEEYIKQLEIKAEVLDKITDKLKEMNRKYTEEYLKALKEDLDNGIELIDILTKELYKANCYAVERKEEC